jgi:hypothetical protein
MWMRRSLEIATDLVLFSSTDEDQYYAHYILLQRYRYFKRIVHDTEKYYDKVNSAFTMQLYEVSQQLNIVQAHIDPNRAWYLNKRGKLDLISNRDKISSRAASFQELLGQALLLESGAARSFLGRSYMGIFGMSSSMIHYMGVRVYEAIRREQVNAAAGALRLQQHYISYRIGVLLGEHHLASIINLQKIYGSSKLDEITGLDDRLGASKGDYVYVFGRIGVITSVHISQIGYISYEVEVVVGQRFPYDQKDWFRAENLLKIDFCALEREILIEMKKRTGIVGFVRKEFFSAEKYYDILLRKALALYEHVYSSTDIDARYQVR